MIRKRNGGHLVLNCSMNKVVYAARSIEKAVVGVVMDMDKLRHRLKAPGAKFKYQNTNYTSQSGSIVTTLST
ncbi:MAG TPA: hypothetical protein DGH68_01000 [Bacteroidetes bacterium]|nr:hypothetical protein [Bacteroidota bacterium]